MLLYSAALTLGLALAAPWWLLRMATTQRYREGMRQRLGFVPKALRSPPAGTRTVWLHAVSVGEVLAASRLVGELEDALVTRSGQPWRIVLSTTTRTGQALARERFGTDRVVYMPLDFAWAVRAWLRALRPAAIVLMESEVWPRLLYECRRAAIPVAVVNARLSDRSFARALRVRRLWTPVLRHVTLWLAQSAEDAYRLLALGVADTSVQSIGNLKYDVRTAQAGPMSAAIRRIAAGRPILVAGSTLGAVGSGWGENGGLGEEEMLIQAWEGPLRVDRKTLLVLAPRHPERFAEVSSLAFAFRAVNASALSRVPLGASSASNGEMFLPDLIEIVVLDTIGDLASVYGIADAAFVGGSLVKRGGHNPLEPAQFGVPVVMGSSYQNFRSVVAAMAASDGIRIVCDQLELEASLWALLTDRDSATAMGRRGQQVFELQQGATARATAALVNLISPHSGVR